MKKKICMGLLLLPAAALADMFGGDLVILGKILVQGVQEVRQTAQMVDQGMQAYQQTRAGFAFVTSPGAWKSMLSSGATVMLGPSNGRDVIALSQATQSRNAALQAIRQISSDPQFTPNASNTAELSLLNLHAAQATMQANELQQAINYHATVAQYRAGDPGLTQTVGDMNSWHLHQ